MLYVKKEAGTQLTREEDAKLKSLIKEGRKLGLDILAMVKNSVDDTGPNKLDPFPASAVARNQKKIEQALEKRQRAPIKPLFFLANVCTDESWMRPAVEAGVLGLLKRVAELERKLRAERNDNVDSSRLQWCVFGMAELCMQPTAAHLIDIDYFYEIMVKKESSVFEKNMASKALADRMVALGEGFGSELLRVLQDAAVMEEISLQTESNEVISVHIPQRLASVDIMDNLVEIPVAVAGMRLMNCLYLVASSNPSVQQFLAPFKERNFRRFQELYAQNALKEGVGQNVGVKDPVQTILKEYGLLSASQVKMSAMMQTQGRAIYANLQQDTMFRQCQHCKVEESPKKPHSVCSGCRKARYCGPTCAKADWKQHKLECKMPAATKGKKK